MTSLMEKELALATGALKRETTNWVPMWVDWENCVRSDRVKATAMRAMTDEGEALWYVRHDTKKHGYHSSLSDPFAAIEEAEQAWDHRRAVRKDWARLKQVQTELLTGRRKLTVHIEDAYDSALCTLGTKGFLKRMGLKRVKRVSGRTAALLMLVEPQVGFVIHQALVRTEAETGAEITTQTAPIGAI